MANLLIVESPTKAKKIAGLLGSGWSVKASVGHIKDLPKRELGVTLDGNFTLTYVYREPAEKGKSGGKDIVRGLKDAMRGCSRIFLGTDPDREGEAIAWHLAEELGLANAERVEFHAITRAAVEEALAKPRKIDEARVAAQEARRALDRLVGYRVSPTLSDMVGQNASAGRVQTPALRLVVEREREIKNFVSREHYGVELSFDGGWTADWRFTSLLAEGEKIWTDRALADVVSGVRDVEALSCENTIAKRSPSPAFTTSTMQQAANARLKMSPQDAMRVAQRLFENGHITYHRTDDPNLSPEGVAEIRAFAQSKGLQVAPAPRRWKAKGGAQEAHEGIRPTHIEVEVAGESDQDKALYSLIRMRALASQLADALYDVRTVVLRSVDAVLGTGPAEFVASGRVLKSAGWRAIVGDTVSEAEDKDEERNNPVPEIAAGTRRRAVAGETKVKHTSPPSAFTAATLIAELEKREIGRPSTYASIMATLGNRGYVTEDKQRKMHPTSFGEVVVDALVNRFSFADCGFTRVMEAELDKIAAGAGRYVDVVRAGNTVLDQELARLSVADVPKVKREGPTCPTCHDGVLVRRKGKHGFFWSCDAFRRTACKGLYRDNRGKPDFTPRAPVTIDENAPTCPQCGKGKLVQRKSQHGTFYGCSEFKNGCKVAYKTLPSTDAA